MAERILRGFCLFFSMRLFSKNVNRKMDEALFPLERGRRIDRKILPAIHEKEGADMRAGGFRSGDMP
jgi:hypothetical protein